MNNGEPFVPKSFVHRYLTYANSLLASYLGKEPFHLYLKKYFSKNKKHGSGDRKIITSLCYDYFRLGLGVSSEIGSEEKFLLGTFLVEQKPSKILEKLKPEWNELVSENILKKTEVIRNIFNPVSIFPFNDELSSGIDAELFNSSFLIQPKLFIRIRPGKEKMVVQKLKKANIFFEKVNDTCLAFSNNEKISDILLIDEEVVIQDYNSQRTPDFLTSNIERPTSNISLWDCCAASGGKSIQAYDLFKNIELTVSDTRKNILKNLKIRFAKAGIKKYTSFIADLSVSPPLEGIKGRLDVIIADVPCSGSGTWARTPEQLSYFEQNQIKRYAKLQQQIVLNALQCLKENGYLLYITCSVFKEENEGNVDFFLKKTRLKLIGTEYLKGYEMQADTLFVALFKS